MLLNVRCCFVVIVMHRSLSFTQARIKYFPIVNVCVCVCYLSKQEPSTTIARYHKNGSEMSNAKEMDVERVLSLFLFCVWSCQCLYDVSAVPLNTIKRPHNHSLVLVSIDKLLIAWVCDCVWLVARHSTRIDGARNSTINQINSQTLAALGRHCLLDTDDDAHNFLLCIFAWALRSVRCFCGFLPNGILIRKLDFQFFIRPASCWLSEHQRHTEPVSVKRLNMKMCICNSKWLQRIWRIITSIHKNHWLSFSYHCNVAMHQAIVTMRNSSFFHSVHVFLLYRQNDPTHSFLTPDSSSLFDRKIKLCCCGKNVSQMRIITATKRKMFCAHFQRNSISKTNADWSSNKIGYLKPLPLAIPAESLAKWKTHTKIRNAVTVWTVNASNAIQSRSTDRRFVASVVLSTATKSKEKRREFKMTRSELYPSLSF